MANLKPRCPRPEFDPIFKNGKLSTDKPGPVRALFGSGVNHPAVFPTDDGFTLEFWINPDAKDADITKWFKQWAAWHIYDYLQHRRQRLRSTIKGERNWPGTKDPAELEKQKADLAREAELQKQLAAECQQRGDFREEADHIKSAHLFEGYLALLKMGKTETPTPWTIERRLKNLRGQTVSREQIYDALRHESKQATKKKGRVKSRRQVTP